MAEVPISISPDFRGVVQLGVLAFDGVTVSETPEAMKAMLAELAAEQATRYAGVGFGEIPVARGVRQLFHRAGVDPTRHRPSSESLLRRATRNLGFYTINSVVDLINYFSLKTLLPIGLYDRDRVSPPIELRVGVAGETYDSLGRGALNLENFPVLVDTGGPFGAPVSDSQRTSVGMGTSRILWITFAPMDGSLPLDEMAESMIRWNGGDVAFRAVIS